MAEAQEDLSFVQNAPHNTPVERVDEVGAARHPVLRWSESLRELTGGTAGPPFGDNDTPPTPTA